MLRLARSVRIAAPVAVAAMLVGAAVTANADPAPAVSTGTTTLATINDAGQPTTFTLQWATTAQPSSLVVVFHGHGHNADQWQAAGELSSAAGQDNAIVVAPMTTETTAANGKGTFDTVDEEARDAAAAIAWARATHHLQATYLMCASMGCAGLAYFIDALGRPAAGDADATFVKSQHVGPIRGVLAAEGLSNLVETWAEAGAADPTTQAEIEQETGGTPVTTPTTYRSRSLALLPPHRISRLHLQEVAIVHDVDDGLVPYNQAVETRAEFVAAGTPYHGYTVVGNQRTGCSSTNETTLTAEIGNEIPGVGTTLEPTLCLAGHATETNPNTPVMHAAFTVLHWMTVGGHIGVGEAVWALP